MSKYTARMLEERVNYGSTVIAQELMCSHGLTDDLVIRNFIRGMILEYLQTYDYALDHVVRMIITTLTEKFSHSRDTVWLWERALGRITETKAALHERG